MRRVARAAAELGRQAVAAHMPRHDAPCVVSLLLFPSPPFVPFTPLSFANMRVVRPHSNAIVKHPFSHTTRSRLRVSPLPYRQPSRTVGTQRRLRGGQEGGVTYVLHSMHSSRGELAAFVEAVAPRCQLPSCGAGGGRAAVPDPALGALERHPAAQPGSVAAFEQRVKAAADEASGERMAQAAAASSVAAFAPLPAAALAPAADGDAEATGAFGSDGGGKESSPATATLAAVPVAASAACSAEVGTRAEFSRPSAEAAPAATGGCGCGGSSGSAIHRAHALPSADSVSDGSGASSYVTGTA